MGFGRYSRGENNSLSSRLEAVGVCFAFGQKKSRAHEPFGSCALFQLRRKVFMLPGSICRENIPAPFSWQEVSFSFSVETCAHLCKKLAPVVAPHFRTSVLECGSLVSRRSLKERERA